MSREFLTPVNMNGNRITNAANGSAATDLATVGQVRQVIPPSGDTTGVTDTTAINTVIQSAAAAMLESGTYYITNLLPDSYGAIIGTGDATVLSVVSETTGYAIALKTPATTARILLQDFQVSCNDVCGGIQLDNTGFTPSGSYVPYDPLHTLENIFVLGANGDAFHFDNNARELRVHACKQYYCSGYGFYLGPGAASDSDGCTDSHFTDCTSGQSGLDGWYIADTAANNMFTSCKGFYSGFTESTGDWDTTSVGFNIQAGFCTFVSCSAQQAALHGFYLNGCTNVTLAGCEADTNSAGTGVTTGVGIEVDGVSYCSVVGCTGGLNTYDPPGAQAYGIQIDGTVTGTSLLGNSVTGASTGINLPTYVNGGGNVIIDYSQAVMGSTAILQGNPSAYLQGQASLPAGVQYFSQLTGYDPASTGYGTLGFVTGSGLGGIVQQSQRAATSAVTVTAASITSLGSLTVPANDPVAGARYKVTAYGTLGTASSVPTFILDLRWGGTGGTLITSIQSTATANAPALTASLSAAPVLIEGEITFVTSTTCVAWLRMTLRNSATVTTAPIVMFSDVTTAVTVTTSSSQAASLDWKWSATGTGTTITIVSSSWERVA